MKYLFLLLTFFVTNAQVRVRSKPLCGLCKEFIAKVDDVVKHEGDIEKAVHQFCQEDVPAFLVDTCVKIIEKNLVYIIEKVKQHEPADKICADIQLCTAPPPDF